MEDVISIKRLRESSLGEVFQIEVFPEGLAESCPTLPFLNGGQRFEDFNGVTYVVLTSTLARDRHYFDDSPDTYFTYRYVYQARREDS